MFWHTFHTESLRTSEGKDGDRSEEPAVYAGI